MVAHKIEDHNPACAACVAQLSALLAIAKAAKYYKGTLKNSSRAGRQLTEFLDTIAAYESQYGELK